MNESSLEKLNLTDIEHLVDQQQDETDSTTRAPKNADLAFSYTNNDSSGLAISGPNMIMQLDGNNNQILFPTATNTPVGTTAQLLWGTDTNLYRDSANTLKTDDSLVVTGNLSAGATTITTLTVNGGTAANPSLQFAGSTNTGFSAASANRLSFDTLGVERASLNATALISQVAVQTPFGSATAPAYTFSGDTNTGIYDKTADTLGFATNGTERMSIDSTGTVNILGTLVIAAGTAAQPSLKFTNGTNTGFSSPTTNKISFDANGVEKMTIDATTVRATTTFISAAACIMAKEVCLGGIQVDTPAGGANSVTIADGKSVLLILPSDGNVTSYAITMPANPFNGQILTIMVGNAVQVNSISFPGSTVYYAVDQLRTTTPMDPNSNGQSVTFIYYNGTWYRFSRG